MRGMEHQARFAADESAAGQTNPGLLSSGRHYVSTREAGLVSSRTSMANSMASAAACTGCYPMRRLSACRWSPRRSGRAASSSTSRVISAGPVVRAIQLTACASSRGHACGPGYGRSSGWSRIPATGIGPSGRASRRSPDGSRASRLNGSGHTCQPARAAGVRHQWCGPGAGEQQRLAVLVRQGAAQ